MRLNTQLLPLTLGAATDSTASIKGQKNFEPQSARERKRRIHTPSQVVTTDKNSDAEGKKGKGLRRPRNRTDNTKTDDVVREVAIVPDARR